MPFCDHLLRQPLNPSPLQDTPTYYFHSGPRSADFLTVPASQQVARKNSPHIKKKKLYNPYLELESENILSLTLSQAPAIVRLYICTQSPIAAAFSLFCARCQVFMAVQHH